MILLEFNASFIINLMIWFMLIVFLLAGMVVGFTAIEYQRFNTAVQETVARTGTFHVNQGKYADKPFVINNPEILEVIKNYGYRWVIEPIPNLTAYDNSTLTTKGVSSVLTDDREAKTVNLSDYEHVNGSRKLGKVSGAYFYDKLQQPNPSQGLCQNVADMYNTNQSIVNYVRPQYLDLSDYDANKVASFYKIGDTTKYNPTKETQEFNGVVVKPFMSTNSFEKSTLNGYSFTKENPWSKFVMANGSEPHVKYASQVAYVIVPNSDPRGNNNSSYMPIGAWKFMINSSIFNSKGKVQLVTNQIRSIGNAKPVENDGNGNGNSKPWNGPVHENDGYTNN